MAEIHFLNFHLKRLHPSRVKRVLMAVVSQAKYDRIRARMAELGIAKDAEYLAHLIEQDLRRRTPRSKQPKESK